MRVVNDRLCSVRYACGCTYVGYGPPPACPDHGDPVVVRLDSMDGGNANKLAGRD